MRSQAARGGAPAIGRAPTGGVRSVTWPGEREPLNAGGDGKRVAASRFSRPELLSLVLIPWLIFVWVCIIFAFVYCRVAWLVWTALVISGLACFTQARLSYKDFYRSKFYVAVLSGAALLAGTLVGLVGYDIAFRPYWYYENLSSYVNVLPSDAAAGYSDAGKVIFADEAHLDTSQSMGFREGGVVYCVAPISGDESEGPVQFWAAGVNCCGGRGSFACDDAWDGKARSGMVLGDSSFMLGDHRGRFMDSVRQAEAAYGISSVDTPLFVRWVVDTEKVQHNYWALGAGIFLVACVAYFVFSVAAAALLHEGFRGLA